MTFETYYSHGCNTPIRLYCAGVSRTNPAISAPANAGRFAFVAATTFTIGIGLDAADAHCAIDATGAGLPGTYKALLATSGASAISRFDTSGAPWIRPDHVLVAAHAADLATDTFLAPIDLSATGAAMVNYATWGGATSIGAVGSDDTTCVGWTASDANSHAATGFTGFITRPDFSPAFFVGFDDL